MHLDEDIAADMYRTVRAGYTDSTAYLCINRKDKSKLHGTECLSLSSRTRRHDAMLHAEVREDFKKRPCPNASLNGAKKGIELSRGSLMVQPTCAG